MYLNGNTIETHMESILHELRQVKGVMTNCIRVRSNDLKAHLKAPNPIENKKALMKPLMGLINQATMFAFGYKYVEAGRSQEVGRRHRRWVQVPINVYEDRSTVNIALDSMLCADKDAPGHPLMSTPKYT